MPGTRTSGRPRFGDSNSTAPTTGPHNVTFVGDLAGEDVPTITVVDTLTDADNGAVADVTVAVITPGVAAVNEQQTVTLPAADAGTFTLSYLGSATAAIAFDATAQQVEDALIASANIGAAEVDVAGAAGGPYTVTFQNGLGGAPRTDLVGDATNLTLAAVATGPIVVATTVPGVAPVNEVQRVTIPSTAVKGTFTLTFDGEAVDPLPPTVNGRDLQAALQSLASVGASNVAVS